MGRYNVEFKAFTTGEWYVKTSTDWIASAYSVATGSHYGRAARIFDIETGKVIARFKALDPDRYREHGIEP